MLQEEEERNFLFDISNQVKDFYETSVVFVTQKDYSDVLFKSMCAIHEALKKGEKSQVLELIIDFHLQWLHTVNDIETFKKNIHECTKDDMCQSISYTIDSLSYRMKHFQTYIENHKNILCEDGENNINIEIEIIEDMHKEVTHNLVEKIKVMRQIMIERQYKAEIAKETDELLLWIDKINDKLSIKLCKYLKESSPELFHDLTKILQQIIDDIKTAPSDAGKRMLETLKAEEKGLGTMIRTTAGHCLEINKINQKLEIIDERIRHFQVADVDEPSAAQLALLHKKEYLEARLTSLENLKTNLKELQKLTSVSIEDVAEEDLCVCEDFFQLRIFNHLIPVENRERLVTELCYLWDNAVFGERSSKSIISILSAADIKEEFTDELGTFYIDEHSRKIYKLPDDETLYQPNELGELVPVSDDAEHVYFYDECGRYFFDARTRQRVYKAHATASEYMLDSTGVLLKVKEERDGVTYYYDNYGRYYITKEGKHIYRESDAVSEYENDGLGNLVRIRSHLDIFEPCPDDAHVTEDFKYLKETVGKALRECIGQVLLHQPSDPIKYLSKSLIKYRENIELKDRRARENEELNAERELCAAEERAAAEREAMEAALLIQGGSEASFDSNMLKYKTMAQEGPVSVTQSSK